ncbi:MAG: NUDIX hydrolase [Candidatus Sumerlaeota bacterium]|nr:NUDIX hydrolase [Candidatus Sumerlaeota bacterium]
MSYTYDYPRPMMTADAAVFALREGQLVLLLIQRKRDPFQGHWALPGGFMEMDEPLEQTARRELKEETGLDSAPLHFINLYDDPGRDPRGRVITAAYWGFAGNPPPAPLATDDAAQAQWFALDALPPLAFDHARIILDALAALHDTLDRALREKEKPQ